MSMTDAEPTIDLRKAMGCFATGVTVVTSWDPAGAPVGTTANAVTSVSLDPPLILVCFAQTSLTLAAVREHEAFTVNVLSAEHSELSSAFARSGARDVWETVEHDRTATTGPRLAGCVATLACAAEQITPAGDHEIVIGRVLDTRVSTAGERPLLFYRGAYAALAA